MRGGYASVPAGRPSYGAGRGGSQGGRSYGAYAPSYGHARPGYGGAYRPPHAPGYRSPYSGSYYRGYRGYRGYYGPAYGGYYPRPYYTFRPRFSIGFGINVGFPVPFPVGFSIGAGYGAPYSYGAYGYGGSVGVVAGAPAYGGVSFEIDPPYAQIVVDGTYVGDTGSFGATSQPLTLAAGRHRIEIQAPGFVPVVFDLDVLPGQVIPYRGAMVPGP